MQRGPVEVLVFTFPADVDAVEVTSAIRQVVEADLIHVVDLVLVLRDADGEPELHDLENDLPEELSWLALDPHTLLNDADIELVIETLPRDQQAALVAVEHVWARDTRQRLSDLGAELALYARISTEDAELAFAAEQATAGS